MYTGGEFEKIFKQVGFLLILAGAGLFGLGYMVGYFVFN